MIKKILKGLDTTIIIVALLVSYSRYIATTGLETKEISINNQEIPNDFNGLKVVHFSDLHYKRIITKKRINQLIEEINLINPDIVVFTGDLIDSDSDITEKDISYLKKMLSSIKTKYGKYSVLGNHDYSIDINTIREIYNDSEFNLLENTYDIIYSENNEKIYIGGMSTGEFNNTVTSKLIPNEEIYKILLLHEPDFIEDVSILNANLALAGHSHNGQVNIPYLKKLFLPVNAKKYYEEYYKVNNTDFYISSGIGVSRYNFRLFNTPSINFFRINND